MMLVKHAGISAIGRQEILRLIYLITNWRARIE